MSVMNRTNRLSDPIPPEVLQRAAKGGVPAPDWYVGRLDDGDPALPVSVGGSPADPATAAVQTELATIAHKYRRRPLKDARGTIVRVVGVVAVGSGRLLRRLTPVRRA
jgi:hypothetical protein